MKIEFRPLASLRGYAQNARTHSPEQIAQLAASIRAFGFTNPVLIAPDGEIRAGHGRVEAKQMQRYDYLQNKVTNFCDLGVTGR